MWNDAEVNPASTSLPSAHQLRSAIRAGAVIPAAGTPHETLQESYRILPSGGIFRIDDLVVGEGLLHTAGLIRTVEGVTVPEAGLRELVALPEKEACQLLLLAIIERTRPLWLSAATSNGSLESDFIPDSAERTLGEVLTSEERETLLLQLGRKFSDQDTGVTGAIAEEFLVAEFEAELKGLDRPELASRVCRVSQISDQLGYDITAPRFEGSDRRVEVKGTRSLGSIVKFHLSRNEAERAERDPHWLLVVCRVLPDDSAATVGWLPGQALLDLFPSDSHQDSRWESVLIQMSEADFHAGIPSAI